MGRKVNPNSFRQAILKKYNECKDVDETIKWFNGDKYDNVRHVILWNLREIGVDV